MDNYDNEKKQLIEVAEEAKKRYLFYYENCKELDEIKRPIFLNLIREISDKINFGIDYNEEGNYAAYCDSDNNININKSFWDCIKEEQIAVLIHEINHAISQNNQFNFMVDSFYLNANYLDSYKIIEEGLADINSELIMNYYYENSDVKIPEYEKFKNFSQNSCGYPIDRKVLKTILLFMQVAGEDKNMLLTYYFGNKYEFFDMIKLIGGEKAFDMITKSQDSGRNEEDQLIADEYFRSLESAFIEEMELKDFSSGGYYSTNFDNIYLKENDLAESLRISYFLTKLLKGFDFKKIDKKMIDEIYNKSNGLISQISFSSLGYVSKVVDDLICNWIDNCSSIDDFQYINKIVPNVIELKNGKYMFLLFNKKANIDLTNIKKEDIDKVITIFNQLCHEDVSSIDDEMMGYIYSDNKVLFPVLQQIYNLSNDEQIQRFNLYRGLFKSDKVLLAIRRVLGNGMYLGVNELKEILANEELCNDIRRYIDPTTKEELIEIYINDCSCDNVYDIEKLFPDAFTINNGDFYELAIGLGKIIGNNMNKRKA